MTDGHSMKRYRYILAINSCRKYAQRLALQQQYCLNTHTLPDDVLLLYVLGDAENGTSYLEGNILHLASGEAYEDLPDRTRALCAYVTAHYDFDHLIKCDDDVYLYLDRLMAFDCKGADYIGSWITTPPNSQYHFGKCVDKSREVPFHVSDDMLPYAEGACYIASKRFCREIAGFDAAHIYEDTMVGHCFNLHQNSSIPPLVRMTLSGFVPTPYMKQGKDIMAIHTNTSSLWQLRLYYTLYRYAGVSRLFFRSVAFLRYIGRCLRR
jgi:hypothetical protein